MMVLLYGQPASGKTTLANEMLSKLCLPISIDGDKWRDITKNKDYSKDGRIRNLKGAFDMALYLENSGFTPILSFVCPYEEMRSYLLDNAKKIYLIYLEYNEDRGRFMNFANDFEEGKCHLKLNTSTYTIDECLKKIMKVIIAS